MVSYQRALLVIQRWVREHIARKRLFVTRHENVGIGWQAIQEDDLNVKITGLKTRIVLRNVGVKMRMADRVIVLLGHATFQRI